MADGRTMLSIGRVERTADIRRDEGNNEEERAYMPLCSSAPLWSVRSVDLTNGNT